MSTEIANNDIQICISKVDAFIQKHEIFKYFCRLKIGYIENIMEFPIKSFERRPPHQSPQYYQTAAPTDEYKRIIIKLKWNQTKNAKKFLERFKENKTIKVIYSEDPWFWVCKPYISYEPYKTTPPQHNLHHRSYNTKP